MHPLWQPCGRACDICPRLLTMPAIDPNRLARQVDDLIAMPDEPFQIARVVRDLVEEYSAQARSSVPSVPRPVIRSLRGANIARSAAGLPQWMHTPSPPG